MKKLPLFALCGILALTISCKKEKEESTTESPTMKSVDNPEATPETSLENTPDANPDLETARVETSGSEDYDKMLDDYDEYVTEYIKFYKKAMKGDNSAMSEYSSMMEKATSLQQSMQEAQGNGQLSTEQIARMGKIQAKMLKGIQ